MRLEYKTELESQNIDLAKLRPNRSYDYLIENRNAAFSDVLSDPVKKGQLLRQRSCPNCEETASVVEASKDGFDIVKCRACDLLYVNPLFDERAYIDLYDSNDYNSIVTQISISSHEYRRDRFGVERAEFIDRHHEPTLPKTFLEIGCASGFTLEAIEKLGWDATGLELTAASVDFGKGRGLNILREPLEEFDAKKKKFSAIALFDVLEHLSDPRATLKLVHELMCDGGNLFLYVPNWNSATRYLLGVEDSHFIWPTHHLTYFTPETLADMLERAGFEMFHWETQGLDLADYLWQLNTVQKREADALGEKLELFQFFINASGHGKNLRMFARKR